MNEISDKLLIIAPDKRLHIWKQLLPAIKIDYTPKLVIDENVKLKILDVIEADVHRSNIPGISKPLL